MKEYVFGNTAEKRYKPFGGLSKPISLGRNLFLAVTPAADCGQAGSGDAEDADAFNVHSLISAEAHSWIFMPL